MAKVDKRFTILFSDEELQLLKHQADVRGLSSSELARVAIQNEITKKTNYDRITALRRIQGLSSNMDIPESES